MPKWCKCIYNIHIVESTCFGLSRIFSVVVDDHAATHILFLNQFSGINGVLYYTPQILEQAGVGVLLSNLGIGSESASFLISGLTTLLMLPSIGIAMRLMDIAGRR